MSYSQHVINKVWRSYGPQRPIMGRVDNNTTFAPAPLMSLSTVNNLENIRKEDRGGNGGKQKGVTGGGGGHRMIVNNRRAWKPMGMEQKRGNGGNKKVCVVQG